MIRGKLRKILIIGDSISARKHSYHEDPQVGRIILFSKIGKKKCQCL